MSSVNQPILDFKSASIYAVRLVLQSPDTSALTASLQQRLAAAGDFFDGEPVVIDALALEHAADWRQLAQLLLAHSMPVVGVAAAEALHDSIRDAGLAVVRLPAAREATSSSAATLHRDPTPVGTLHRDPPQATPPASSASAGQAPEDAVPDMSAPAAAPAHTASSVQAEAHAKRADSAANTVDTAHDGKTSNIDGAQVIPGAAGYRPTLLLDRSLRSGQKVYARDADLIVVGMVSAGAEVIADGNIHVYGPLRGKAMAGARGDEDARIFTTRLEAELVAVAGVYRVIETALPDEVRERPATVRLQDGGLRIEPLTI